MGRKRTWQSDWSRERAPRNRNWETRWDSRRHSFRWMLRDFLIRLVAFTVLCVIALAWLKFHYLEGMYSFPN